MNKKTLTELYNKKNNSFTIMSIICSLLIIFYHCYPLFYGPNSKTDIFTRFCGSETLGGVIVAMFFVVSGFMITTSIKNSRNILQYLKKRIKKIFPPLIFCLIICACVICPIVSEIPKFTFLKTPSLYLSYIIDNTFLIKNTVYRIADVFSSVPYVGAINGSIWTLKHQFFMYILMIPIYLIFIKKENKKENYKYLCLLLLTITMITYTGYYDKIINWLVKTLGFIGIFAESKQLIRLIYYFCIGVFMNLYSDKIEYSKESIIIAFLISILTFPTKIFTYISLIIIPYLTLYIGSIKSNLKVKDYSYQIFIWGFPIGQVIMHYLNGKINFPTYVFLSLSITFVISIISYYLTEQLLSRRKQI